MSYSRSAFSTIFLKDFTFKILSIFFCMLVSSPKFGFATILFMRFSISSSFSSLLLSKTCRFFAGSKVRPLACFEISCFYTFRSCLTRAC